MGLCRPTFHTNMILSTSYLGLKLKSPFVASASRLSENFDNLKRLEDAGASAIILHSMFEEQIRYDNSTFPFLALGAKQAAEILDFYPAAHKFKFPPDQYLRYLLKASHALDIPVIASLNGSTFGGWTTFAKWIEQAGAVAIELNLYAVPTNPDISSQEIENEYLRIVSSVKAQVKIPVAVKLSPFFTNLGHFVRQLDALGVDGIVLFNRFYQPDIDVDAQRVAMNVNLSSPGDIRLPLRWIAMLHGRIRANLAATGGIHSGTDALKLIMAGADVTMLGSVLMRKGIGYLSQIEREMQECMSAHGYERLDQIRGTLSQQNCPDPSAFARAQYMRLLATDGVVDSDEKNP